MIGKSDAACITTREDQRALRTSASPSLGDHTRNCHPGDFAVTTHYVSRGKRKVCLQ